VRTRAVLGAAVALTMVAGLGLYLGLRHWDGVLPLPLGRACEVRAQGTVTLTAEQMANAATIAAVGVRRGIPERGVVVALATAYQESSLENLAGGDRDSVGLFQQRPSTGWGTAEQIRDPRYAARKFYDALRKVRGWEQMRVTDAAQAVQRSAFPEAYEKWADESTVLARALLGRAGGAVACTVPGRPAQRGPAASAALGRALTLDWGDVNTTTGSSGVSVPAPDTSAGWRYAHWLVAHASGHGVQRVRFAGQEWTARAGRWSGTDSPDTATRVVAEVFAHA